LELNTDNLKTFNWDTPHLDPGAVSGVVGVKKLREKVRFKE
jgi:hypothetical protein